MKEEIMGGIEGRVLTQEVEEVLSRLHSTVSDDDVVQLAKQGYGSVERIREVKADMERLVGLVLRGNGLTSDDIARINQEMAIMRPFLYEPEQRVTYVVDGVLVDLAYVVFPTYVGSGRMKECEYEKCKRVYVADIRRAGKRAPRFCSRRCLERVLKPAYIRELRKQRKKE